MKRFLAIYMGSTSGEAMKKWNAFDEATRNKKQQEGMIAWMKWAEKNAKAILDNGAPLGKTKQTNSEGVSDFKNLMTGYTIVEAESHDVASKMFLDHPHFSVFPGESIEIMEILPIPEM